MKNEGKQQRAKAALDRLHHMDMHSDFPSMDPTYLDGEISRELYYTIREALTAMSSDPVAQLDSALVISQGQEHRTSNSVVAGSSPAGVAMAADVPDGFIGPAEAFGIVDYPKPVAVDLWQPIETAPKDGSWFLVYDPESFMAWAPYEFASWQKPNPDEMYCDSEGNYHKNTIGYFCQMDTSEESYFTKWMPLPKQPQNYNITRKVGG